MQRLWLNKGPLVTITLLVLLLSSSLLPLSLEAKVTSKYDNQICSASKLYLPIPTRLFGCELWKAQLYQESLLDPNAVSPAGAEGIAQFMPATWKERVQKMRLGNVNPRMADVAIKAGAHYMRDLRSVWKSKRTEKQRMKLAQASYNAGTGNILKAQRKANGALDWETISRSLHLVTGHHSKETRTYVDRIWRYWRNWRLS